MKGIQNISLSIMRRLAIAASTIYSRTLYSIKNNKIITLMFEKVIGLFEKKKYETFTGIIDEDGVGIVKTGDSIEMGFSFFAYTINNSKEVIENEIYVTEKIPSMNYDVSKIEVLDIIRIIGIKVNYNGKERIELKSIKENKVNHEELLLAKEKRIKPVIYESEKFGKLQLERGPDWFTGTQEWCGSKIELMLIGEEVEKPFKADKQAIKLFNFQDKWNEKLKEEIIQELLRNKNENWLNEDETPITKEHFINRINIISISVWEDGDFEVWYNDGDLFWGHDINVNGNIAKGIEDVGLAG